MRPALLTARSVTRFAFVRAVPPVGLNVIESFAFSRWRLRSNANVLLRSRSVIVTLPAARAVFLALASVTGRAPRRIDAVSLARIAPAPGTVAVALIDFCPAFGFLSLKVNRFDGGRLGGAGWFDDGGGPPAGTITVRSARAVFPSVSVAVAASAFAPWWSGTVTDHVPSAATVAS